MIKRCIPGFFFLVVSLSFTSANFVIEEQPFEIYNVGDKVEINVSIIKNKETLDFFEVRAVCEDEFLVYRKQVDLKAEESFYLEWVIDSSIEGGEECYLEFEFDGQKDETKKFEISDDINIEYEIKNKFLSPGDEFEINGTAVKENFEKLEGLGSIFIEGVIDQDFDVEDGRFHFSFSLGNDLRPGEYDVEISVFEKGRNDEVINEGIRFGELVIESSPSSIEIVSPESIRPPGNVSLFFNLLDQAGDPIENESVAVRILNPIGNITLDRLVETGREFNYDFGSDAVEGGWNVRAFYGGISESRPIYVRDNEQVDINYLEDAFGGYIEIVNVGNVVYEGVVELVFDDGNSNFSVPLNLTLGLGEEHIYRPELEGSYNLSAEGKDIGNVIFTGAVVGVGNSKSGGIFLFLAVFLIASFLAVYLMKKKGFAFYKSFGVRGKSPISVETQKKAYILFFKVQDPEVLKDFEKYALREGVRVNKLKGSVCYVGFTSLKYVNPEEFILEFVKKARSIGLNNGGSVAVSVHSSEFDNKMSSLKRILLEGRAMLDLSEGRIVLTENVYDRIKNLDNNVKFGSYKDLRIGSKSFQTFYLKY